MIGNDDCEQIEGAIAQLEALPLVVLARRMSLGLSLRECASDMGIANSTLFRLEACEGVSIGTVVRAFRWLVKTS